MYNLKTLSKYSLNGKLSKWWLMGLNEVRARVRQVVVFAKVVGDGRSMQPSFSRQNETNAKVQRLAVPSSFLGS